MPVPAYNGPNSSTGNGVTTVFPYTFRILDEDDLLVTVDGVPQALNVAFTLSGVGDAGGGNVTFNVAPANGKLVVRSRARPYARSTDYQRNGAFDEETVDADFDAIVMMIQQMEAEKVRSFKAPTSVGVDAGTLTQAMWDARASKILGFDPTGVFSTMLAQDVAITAIASAYTNTLLPLATAANWRSTLEITRTIFGKAAGTVNALTVDFTPDLAAHDETALLLVELAGANTLSNPSLSPDGLAAKTIVKGADQVLDAGDLPGAGGLAMFRYDASLDKYTLLNPAFVVTKRTSLYEIRNLGAAVSLAGNALTFALKDAAGADPSAASPVELDYQHATVTTGQSLKRKVTAALGITIPATALMGTVSGFPSRIYFGLLDNAGALELCCWNPISLTAIASATTFMRVGGVGTGGGMKRIDPGSVESTTTISAGADLSHVVYSATGRANVRVFPIAYVDSTQATAGNWATAITRLTLIGPNTPMTGDVLQQQSAALNTVATGTTVVPLDDTVPDSGSDGDLYLTLAGPSRIAEQNPIDVSASIQLSSSVATDGMTAYITGEGTALQVAAGHIVAAGDVVQLTPAALVLSSGGATPAFGVQAGGSAAGTTTVNGRAGVRTYGGAMASTLTKREICA